MKTLTNAGLKTMVAKVWFIKGWRMLCALTLVAAFAPLSALGPTPVALADEGGGKGHTFNVTFTIWMTAMPANPPSFAGVPLAGVVGGAVGNGSLAALVLSNDLSLEPGFWLGYSQFKVYGEDHSFIADVHETQDNTTLHAMITGVVTQGWLKGAYLTGEYTGTPACPIATPGNVFGTLCFQGTLHIHRGPDEE